MFGFIKRPAIYDSQFEQMLTYDIAIPTDADIRRRIDECNKDLATRGLSGFSPHATLEKDRVGSMLLQLHRANQLRGILNSHGWRQEQPSN